MANEITTKGIKNNKYKKWIDICNSKGMDAVVEEVRILQVGYTKELVTVKRKRYMSFVGKDWS